MLVKKSNLTVRLIIVFLLIILTAGSFFEINCFLNN
ncbi:hypothetical protein QFZ80_002888 [Paenibacillus sp. V4I7]|nr:hypothetical protein [Paenibacillus sp. V4I7]MDQ0914955.1 hypothetical protein [Paenibacillus sp. V4I5]